MARPTEEALDAMGVAKDGFKPVIEMLRMLRKLREQSEDNLDVGKQETAIGLLRIATAQAEAMEGLLQELHHTYLIP